MLLVLWQSHIPPAAQQLTGMNTSQQIGSKKEKEKNNTLFKWNNECNKTCGP